MYVISRSVSFPSTVYYIILRYYLRYDSLTADATVATCFLLKVRATTVKCAQTLTSVRTASTRARPTTTPLSAPTTRGNPLYTWDPLALGRRHYGAYTQAPVCECS